MKKCINMFASTCLWCPCCSSFFFSFPHCWSCCRLFCIISNISCICGLYILACPFGFLLFSNVYGNQ